MKITTELKAKRRAEARAIEQKRRRREKRKNAVAKHNSFKKNNPVAYQEGRNELLATIVDIATKSRYPLFQFKLVIT